MPHLRGRITSVSWRDDFTGETLANIGPHGPNPRRLSYPILGMFAHGFVTGEGVEVHGEWEMHPRHGKVFRVSKLDRLPPATREGEIVFLAGYIKGLSKKQAGLLLDKYKDLAGVEDVCRNRPQELEALFPKARKVRARLRDAKWDRREVNIDAFVGLQSAGLRLTQVQELVRFFGAASLHTIAQTTPYMLCQVPKIGFASAEKVARFYAESQGRAVDLLNEERLIYGLCDTIGGERSNGHVCVPEDRLVRAALRRLFPPDARTQDIRARLAAALTEALKRRLLVKEFDMIYPRGLQKAESDLALHIGKLLSGGARALTTSTATILRELRDSGLSEEQQHAVATIGTAPVAVLQGGPGRGKTRTIKSFVDLLDKQHRTYLILAPTGKAAKRAQEMTGKPCYTIHKACGLDREEDIHDRKYGRKIGKRDRFNVDVIIVDESSMLDLPLGFEFFRRVRPGRTAVVMCGDCDQLPPVGAGQVFRDLIRSQAVTVATLTQVFRQANGSPIVDGADAINRGDTPIFRSEGHEVRLFDPSQAKGHPGSAYQEAAIDFEARAINRWLAAALSRYAEDLGVDPLRHIQVYAPRKKGVLGIRALNETLQKLLNPVQRTANQGTIKIDGGYAVQVGDKVMQIRNNYRMRFASAAAASRATLTSKHRKPSDTAASTDAVGVMNGQVGFVRRVDAQRMEIEVQFEDLDEPVLYQRSEEWRQLTPAYCISIHKSQGSETPFAFIVLEGDHTNRPLLYTAWTRAKQGVAVFGTQAQVARAAKSLDGTDRFSNLARRLTQVSPTTARRKIVMYPAAGPSTSSRTATPPVPTLRPAAGAPASRTPLRPASP